MLGNWELEFQHKNLCGGCNSAHNIFSVLPPAAHLIIHFFFFFTLLVIPCCPSLSAIKTHQSHFLISTGWFFQPHPLGLYTWTGCFINMFHQPASSLGVSFSFGSMKSQAVCFSWPFYTALDPRGA